MKILLMLLLLCGYCRADGFTAGTVKSVVTDNTGNSITGLSSNGDRYLQVGEIQDVHIATGNTYTDNIASGGTFTGGWDSTLGVNAIQVSLSSDEPFNFTVQQSTDGVNVDRTSSFRTVSGTPYATTVQAVASYVRIKAIHRGSYTTSYFRLQTALCPQASVEPIDLTTKGVRRGGMFDSLGRGTYTDIFSKLRVVEPTNIFSLKKLYGDRGVYFQHVTFGSGAFITDDSSYFHTTISAGTTATGWSVDTTRTYWNFEPGRTETVLFPTNFWALSTNVSKTAGLFDQNNGYYFMSCPNGQFCVGYRTDSSGSPVDTVIPQSLWDDPLDGYGDSGLTLNIGAQNTFFIEFAWGSVIKYGIIADGQRVYVYSTKSFGVHTSTLSHTPSLPIRFELRNTPGATTAAYMTWAACDIDVDGDYHPNGRSFSERSGSSSASIGSGTNLVGMAVRLQSGWRRANLRCTGYSTSSSSANPFATALYLCQGSAGISGTTPIWHAASNNYSAVEWTNTAFTLTTTTAGVLKIDTQIIPAAGFRSSTGVLNTTYPLIFAGADYNLNPDVIVFVVCPIGGSVTFDDFSMTWEEFF